MLVSTNQGFIAYEEQRKLCKNGNTNFYQKATNVIGRANNFISEENIVSDQIEIICSWAGVGN